MQKPYFWSTLQKYKSFDHICMQKRNFGKTTVLVIHTVLEIFYRDLRAKALVLVIPTELEIFYRDLEAKVLLLVIPTELDQILLEKP